MYRALSATMFIVLATCCASPLYALQSESMRAGCTQPNDSEAQKKAAEWLAKISAFTPENGPPSLRLNSLTEQVEQALLAQGSIRRTCAEYLAGKHSQADADSWLAGYEQTLRDFVHSVGANALANAKTGQVTLMGPIRNYLTEAGGTGRQASLLGLDSIADTSYRMMVETLTIFDAGLAKSCKEQSFDPDIIFALQRQEEALGQNSGLEPCAYRLAKADYSDSRQSWTVHHCGLGYGEWKFKAQGWLNGSGTGETDRQGNGGFSIKYTQFDSRFSTNGQEEGTLRFYCTPEEACKCKADPSNEQCKKKYGAQVPATQWLLDFGLKSVSGEIKMTNRAVPFQMLFPYGVFSPSKQKPVVYQKIDKPCDPEKAD